MTHAYEGEPPAISSRFSWAFRLHTKVSELAVWDDVGTLPANIPHPQRTVT